MQPATAPLPSPLGYGPERRPEEAAAGYEPAPPGANLVQLLAEARRT
jgi:hypothetical protein